MNFEPEISPVPKPSLNQNPAPSPAPAPEIEITDDGSPTLRSAFCGDTYHSVRGAVGEARHVFIEAGFSEALDVTSQQPPRIAGTPPRRGEGFPPVRVFEMGFGSGLNAWLTLEEADRAGRQVEYTAVELYPVPEDVAERLHYTSDPGFAAMHRAPWGEWAQVSQGFRLLKLHDDLVRIKFSSVFDVIYYDAFAPETQPELWTVQIFERIFETMSPGAILVTYSAKGDVRRALQSAGFTVEKLPGALGKRHMLRAKKL